MGKPEGKMQKVTTKQAAYELGISVEVLQYLLRHDRLPIGYAVRREGKKRASYHIYRGLLDGYKTTLEGSG